MIKQMKQLGVAAVALLTGCAAVDPASVPDAARPNADPVSSVTQFEDALACMDRAFSDFGVNGVSLAVSAVPDYTGRAYVGSDIWLQSAINKMSQRSGAFIVTDFNPNQLAPEQSLWSLSAREGFYIPAYYVRGAISGFAGNVAEASGTIGGATATDSGAITFGSSYSLVSVDLNLANLQQRTLIPRAQASNEVALQSRAAGSQLGGVLSSYGANIEIVASRSEGIPQAVRALVELNAIEVLGRLTGVPYWSCLNTDHTDPEAVQARADIFINMTDVERVVFLQRRLGRLGYYSGELNGVADADLMSAIDRFAYDAGLSPDQDDLALFGALTAWEYTEAPAGIRLSLGQTAPQVASMPLESDVVSQGQGLSAQISIYSASSRPGAPVSFSLQSSQTAYAYCYLQDVAGNVARVFPNRWQPDPVVPGDRAVDVPGAGAGFNLVLPQAGAQENIACFVSSAELGSRLPNALMQEDLAPLPVTSLQALKQRFGQTAAELQGELVVEEVLLASE